LKTIVQNFVVGNEFDVKRIGSKNFINTFNKSFGI
jgi:hypothetical protein